MTEQMRQYLNYIIKNFAGLTKYEFDKFFYYVIKEKNDRDKAEKIEWEELREKHKKTGDFI